MNKQKILDRLVELKNESAMVETESGCMPLINISEGYWEIKSSFGWLEGDAEELADELSSWEEEIIRID